MSDDEKFKDSSSAWIAPDGTTTFVMGGTTHSSIAREQLGDSTGGRHLERQGYIHVSYGNVGLYDRDPTQAQLTALGDMVTSCNEHGLSYSARLIANYIAAATVKESLS